MAQKYPVKKFVELCFFDNGITISGSFNKRGMIYKDEESHKAICDALKGLSSKEEGRGYGLRTCMNIFLEELDGEILIVSGSGALYVSKDEKHAYILTEHYKLKGTLISIRVDDKDKKIDIYKYIE